jgi:creatinine amidohydrolase
MASFMVHGPHCSLGTDVLIPREFVRRLDSTLGDKILMAPEIPYGHSWALTPFEGTIDVSANAFMQYVYEIAKEYHRNGFKHIILFNGHGGNIASLMIIAEKLADLGATVLTINWWIDYKEAILKITSHPGHAGEDETSLVLAIDESLVDQKGVGHHHTSVPFNVKFKDWGKAVFPDGYLGNAADATVEKGEKLYQELLPLILQDIESMWKVNK